MEQMGRRVLAEREECSLFLPAPLYATNTRCLEKANLRESKCNSKPQHAIWKPISNTEN